MKRKIDLGLAVLCSREWRETHGAVGRYDVMAEACDCSWQALWKIEKQALEKMRVRLLERGVSRVEALMVLEVLSQGDSYYCPLDL